MTAANQIGRSITVPLTNKSGGSVAKGDVVYLNDGSTTDSFTTGTTAAYTGGIGVVLDTSIASNAIGLVIIGGYAPLVNVDASVTIGHYGKTKNVAKQGTDAGTSRIAGTFCQFETGGTTPDAVIWQPDLGAGTGTTVGSTLQRVSRTTGSITLVHGTSTMIECSSALRLTLPATAGDVVMAGFSFALSGGVGEGAIDIATLVSGTIQHQFSAGSRGVGFMLYEDATISASGSLVYTTVSGDISGGNVVVSPTFVNPAGSGDFTLLATTTYAATLWAVNLKQ